MTSARLAAIACTTLSLAPGCRIMLGLSADELVSETCVEAGESSLLAVEGIELPDEALVVRGGDGTMLCARMSVTTWQNDHSSGQDFAIALRPDRDNVFHVDRRVHGERQTNKSFSASLPAGVGLDLDVTARTILVSDLDAPVHILAHDLFDPSDGEVVVEDVAASVDVTASTDITVMNTGPVELDSGSSIEATIAQGGVIKADKGANITVTGSSFDELRITSEDEATVKVPFDGSFTVVVKGSAIDIAAGDIAYRSSVDPAYVAGTTLMFDINGGGPLIEVSSASSSVTVTDG